MSSNPNLTLNNGSELADLPRKAGPMERLAKNVRQAVLPLVLLLGGCATIQSYLNDQDDDLAEIEELAPTESGMPIGFEKTNLASTDDGFIFDLSTFFRVGGSPGFRVKFEMVELPVGAAAPERISYKNEVKMTYDIVDPKDLAKLSDEASKKKMIGHANYLYVLRETKKTLTEMVYFMKKRKPNGFDPNYDYGDYFEALKSQMSKVKNDFKNYDIDALKRPAMEKMLGQEFPCFASGDKSPERTAMEHFAKENRMTIGEAEANYVAVIVSQPKGPFREMVAKVLKKTDVASADLQAKPATLAEATVDELSKPFPCFANAGMSPEQAAMEQFAKDNTLPIKEVESGYSVEIVSQPEGPFRKMVARMIKKKPVTPAPTPKEEPKIEPAPKEKVAPKPVPETQEQPKAKLTPQQQKLADQFLAIKPEKRLVAVKEDRIQVRALGEPGCRSIIEKGIVTKNSYPILDQVAGAILANNIKGVRIEAHTDSRSDNGDTKKQIEHSRNCAESVKAFLESKGILPSQLATEGLGSAKPVAPNLTARGRELNRRIEFMFLAPDEQSPNEEDELK